jgi:hypothetical protein
MASRLRAAFAFFGIFFPRRRKMAGGHKIKQKIAKGEGNNG